MARVTTLAFALGTSCTVCPRLRIHQGYIVGMQRWATEPVLLTDSHWPDHLAALLDMVRLGQCIGDRERAGRSFSHKLPCPRYAPLAHANEGEACALTAADTLDFQTASIHYAALCRRTGIPGL
jgi:hypothetical protein